MLVVFIYTDQQLFYVQILFAPQKVFELDTVLNKVVSFGHSNFKNKKLSES